MVRDKTTPKNRTQLESIRKTNEDNRNKNIKEYLTNFQELVPKLKARQLKIKEERQKKATESCLECPKQKAKYEEEAILAKDKIGCLENELRNLKRKYEDKAKECDSLSLSLSKLEKDFYSIEQKNDENHQLINDLIDKNQRYESTEKRLMKDLKMWQKNCNYYKNKSFHFEKELTKYIQKFIKRFEKADQSVSTQTDMKTSFEFGTQTVSQPLSTLKLDKKEVEYNEIVVIPSPDNVKASDENFLPKNEPDKKFTRQDDANLTACSKADKRRSICRDFYKKEQQFTIVKLNDLLEENKISTSIINNNYEISPKPGKKRKRARRSSGKIVKHTVDEDTEDQHAGKRKCVKKYGKYENGLFFPVGWQ